MYREVIFDIETKKLFDQIEDRQRIEDLGVSVVSAYRRVLDDSYMEIEGEMASFWDEGMQGRRKLGELWEWLVNADRVIGFNSIKFDAPVLNPHMEGDVMRLKHFDILEKVRGVLGHRLSLDALAKETLGETKMANGLAAVDWWQAGDEESLEKLQRYCEMDVEVTKRLYDVGLREGRLKYMSKWNEPKEIEVDFSYPKKEEEPQLGLF
jgi:DEAD/DEAH box helicase domain-containing protein